MSNSRHSGAGFDGASPRANPWYFDCSQDCMIAVLILAGLVAAGLLIGYVATATAPVGFQDETGFHYGPGETDRHAELTAAVAHAKAV